MASKAERLLAHGGIEAPKVHIIVDTLLALAGDGVDSTAALAFDQELWQSLW